MTTDARIDAYIAKTLANSKTLTSEQRAKLAELLKPVRGKAGAS
ncbi:MAG TPA: hypothetical protein VMC78_15345 [Mycobacterium sp.]|nr:hypothetical protein [Mycobacterium sp.]